MNLRIVVAPDGRVKNVASGDGSELRDAYATNCIVAQARKLVFPAKMFGSSERTVIYPLRLIKETGRNGREREMDVLRQIQ